MHRFALQSNVRCITQRSAKYMKRYFLCTRYSDRRTMVSVTNASQSLSARFHSSNVLSPLRMKPRSKASSIRSLNTSSLIDQTKSIDEVLDAVGVTDIEIRNKSRRNFGAKMNQFNTTLNFLIHDIGVDYIQLKKLYMKLLEERYKTGLHIICFGC